MSLLALLFSNLLLSVYSILNLISILFWNYILHLSCTVYCICTYYYSPHSFLVYIIWFSAQNVFVFFFCISFIVNLTIPVSVFPANRFLTYLHLNYYHKMARICISSLVCSYIFFVLYILGLIYLSILLLAQKKVKETLKLYSEYIFHVFFWN